MILWLNQSFVASEVIGGCAFERRRAALPVSRTPLAERDTLSTVRFDERATNTVNSTLHREPWSGFD
ncbi:MAG: hypothetical protein B7X07_01655 [Actinobacteria bacterium 21-64-8]|nr:MAG: hypothetical protein B7X07_01655 [Actinobacteria bacterium 21-64-8]